MISRRILPLFLAALAVIPFVATTAEARDNIRNRPSHVKNASQRNNTGSPLWSTSNTKEMLAKRPAHIDRLAWRNRASKPNFVDNDRKNNRTRYIARAWHPKLTSRRLQSLACTYKK